MTLWGIAENLLSDVIFISLAIIVSWIWVSVTRRRKLRLFFHTNNVKRLIIYLSDINVLPFGATGKSGKKLSYQGHAVAYGEVQGGSHIKNLFSFIIPKLAEASETIGKLFLSDILVQTVISPPEKTKLDSQASFVALGSPAYNVASSFIEEFDENIAKFQFGYKNLSEMEHSESHSTTVVFSSSDPAVYPQPGTVDIWSRVPEPIPSGIPYDPENVSRNSELIQNALDAEGSECQSSGILIEGIPPITDTAYGFVERILDPEENRALFYVAGLSEYSTKAASYYLASQWLALYKKYGTDKSFLIMLRFDESNFEKWSVVFERELP